MDAKALASARAWRWSAVLVGVGLAESGYLLARVFASLASLRPGGFDLCSALFAADCGHALADERYWFLRVPLAGWGLVYFTTLGGLLFLSRFLKREFEAEALLAALLLSVAGAGFGLALTAGALLGGAPPCPLCLSVHAIDLLLPLALLRASGRTVAELIGVLRAGQEWLLRPGSATSDSARWKIVGFGSAALLAAVAYQWVYVEAALRRPQETHPPDRARVLAAYRAAPRVALPLSEADPHLGPLGAPVQLVVFESFRCPGCRRLAGTLSDLERRYRDRLLIVYKHYPLSKDCNARLTVDMQPGACDIAWAAEAANRQARFWPFHDALMAGGADAYPRIIADAVRRLGLDADRFTADRASDSTRSRVAEDIALGNRLKIPGTPAVFLDGRLVPSARAEVLEILIRDALRQAASGRGEGVAPSTRLGRPADEGRPS
ncbi:MAG TPA: DsbA family protein [Candidatus Eisenbacteria bacterium]|jgi:protein-disulfide isomerase/uncharacterized membrane protein